MDEDDCGLVAGDEMLGRHRPEERLGMVPEVVEGLRAVELLVRADGGDITRHAPGPAMPASGIEEDDALGVDLPHRLAGILQEARHRLLAEVDELLEQRIRPVLIARLRLPVLLGETRHTGIAVAAARKDDRPIEEHAVEAGLHGLADQVEGPVAPAGVHTQRGAGAVERVDIPVGAPVGHDLQPVGVLLAELIRVPVHIQV